MPKSPEFSYVDVSNTVYSYGRMQGNADAYAHFAPLGGRYSDFSLGTYEDLSNRLIEHWTAENAINEEGRIRDCNSLRDTYNIGHKHSIEDRCR